MLEGIGAVAWDELTHAYGSAADTPGLLRQAGSDDAEAVSGALSDLHGSIFHQGTVYPATVAAVPFLAELAAGAAHHRADFAWMLGMLADDRHAYGEEAAPVVTAVAAQLDVLVALLDDADPGVREAAAFATVRAGGTAAPLWRRWAVEDDPAARAALALALGETDAPAAEPALAEAAVRGEPPVRVAAAVALLRAERDWPAGTIPALVSAIDADASVTWAWARGGDWSEEIVAAPPSAVAVAVVEEMLRSGNPDTRSAGLWALTARCDEWRSAPAEFVPLVGPMLDDPDDGVRRGALTALRQGGAAAGRFADALAGVAARFPATAGKQAFTAEYRAVETLQRLGDPRWVEPVCVAADAGHHLRFSAEAVRFTPEVRAAVHDRLVARPADAETLAPFVAHWAADAAVLLPRLTARIGPRVAEALLKLGYDDPAAVPHWRARKGDVAAGLAVHRVTGDIHPLLDALRAILAGPEQAPWVPMSALGSLGGALEPLRGVASRYLTGAADPIVPRRDKQILAARVVAAVNGPDGVQPTVAAVLAAGNTSARHAADLIADLPPESVAHLEPLLRERLGDRWSRLSAARALARIGVPTAELVEPLVRGITDYAGRFGLPIIAELHAVETVPALAEILARDTRSHVGGIADDVVWADERLLERIRDVIAHLRAR